ncbi:MAG: response regulator transcription factor [Nocardioides sp.]
MSLDQVGRAATIRLVLVADAPLVMAGTVAMLSKVAPEIEVICFSGTPDVPLRADVIVYDPQRHQLAALEQLSRTSPQALVIAFSWSTRPDLVGEARCDGAAAFLSKELSAVEVVTAIRALRAGHHGRFLVQPYAPVAESSTSARLLGLTEREMQIVELITAGLSNDDIAKSLFLSINSVKSYIRTAYRKIGATRRTQAVLWGVEHGLAPQAERRT